MTKKKAMNPANISVSHCHLNGVHFDAKAVEAITTIAEGLVETARALGNLAHVLRASNVHIDTMMKIDAKP